MFRTWFIVPLLVSVGLLSSAATKPQPFSILVVEEMLGRVTIISSLDSTHRVSVPVGIKPHEIAVSVDGRTAYVTNFGLNDTENRAGIPGDTISAIDLATGRERAQFRLPQGLKAPHGVAIRPGHPTELFSNAEQGDRMVVFDGGNGRIRRTFSIPSGIHNFIFSNQGTEIFAFTPGGTVYRLDAATGHTLATREFGKPVRGLAWSSDGHHVLASIKGGVVSLQPENLVALMEFPLSEATQPFYSAASPDGRLLLVPAVFDGDVNVFDARKGSLIRQIHTGTPLRVAISPDPEFAYVANVGPKGDEVSVIDLTTLEVAHIGGLRDANGLAFSAVIPTQLY